MDKEKLQMYRHSLSHILAKAVCGLYKDVKVAIGPAIDNGFYYDFDIPESIRVDDFAKIEQKMREIINKDEKFEKIVLSKLEAVEKFKDEPYKLDLIEHLPANEQHVQ